MSKHPHHGTQIGKLNRIAGQVEGIKKMIDEERYCPDILTQLRAVRCAIRSVEANILEAHLQACVTNAMLEGDESEKRARIAELKDLFKRYDE